MGGRRTLLGDLAEEFEIGNSLIMAGEVERGMHDQVEKSLMVIIANAKMLQNMDFWHVSPAKSKN